jgi:acetyl esterase/lipase
MAAPPKKTQAGPRRSSAPASPAEVSPRWLLKWIGIVLAAALVSMYLTMALLFWQGQWQFTFHPRARVDRTPASAGLFFEPVRFEYTETGEALLSGWWVPGTAGGPTVLYLHGAAGNLADTVPALRDLHLAGAGVFAFDYRGYGESHFEHPSEGTVGEDAEAGLAYLANTRHLPPGDIVVLGEGLGAAIAATLAAHHPQLGAAVLLDPLPPVRSRIVRDARAALFPVGLLVHDNFDL